jgi:anti-anti-sigma factor
MAARAEEQMSSAQIKSKMIDGVAVIYPGPYLNQLRGEMLERECRELMKQGVRRLVINFAETELINSIGISMLLGVMEAAGEDCGPLILTNLNSMNRELFEMLGLTSHVDVEETEEAALLKLCAAVV